MTTIITKRKILFFVPKFPVLTETFIEGEIKKLAERDNLDICVLTLDGDRNSLDKSLKDRVFYHRLNILDVIKSLFFGIFRIDGLIKAHNLFYPCSLSYPKRLFLFLKYLGYTKIINDIKPDFIVAHFLSEPSTICMYASTVLDIPYGISAHARDVTVTSEYVNQKATTAKFILICNKNAQRYLLDQIPQAFKDKVILQYHGVEVKKLSEKAKEIKQMEENKESINKPLIVSIGRLTEKKGFKYLIEASKILKEKNINHIIYIIGPGPLYKDLVEMISKNSLNDTVKILGGGSGLPLGEALGYVKRARIGAFSGIKTDQGDEDGVPNVLLEYASLKVPIVSTDSGSTTDFIEDNKKGILVPQKNSELLAGAIEKLLSDNILAEELSENAYKAVCDKFDIDKNVIELEKLLL